MLIPLRTQLRVVFLLAALLGSAPGYTQTCEVTSTRIPADVVSPAADAYTFQKLGWESFLGLNAPYPGMAPATSSTDAPLWQEWSSIIDMLACVGDTDTTKPAGCACPDGDCNRSGTRYYPASCRGIPGYADYRVLAQLGDLDDNFLQAKTQGLSNDPGVDRSGNFLRYEILASPVTYQNVVDDRLWDPETFESAEEPIVMSCGKASYTGGDPAHPDMGNIVLKVAWMDVTEPEPGLDLSTYHTEKMLIHNPAYRNNSGIESCELREMALVGLHIAHKTARQPTWVWSTFEHRDNAPSCAGGIQGKAPIEDSSNHVCPQQVDRDYNLYGQQCNDDDPACAVCNTSPATNDPGDQCRNPTTADLEGWCLDQAPAAEAGLTQACHQIPVLVPEIDVLGAPIPDPLPDNYPQAAAWNQACVNALTAENLAPWNHYFMISTQWMDPDALPDHLSQPGIPECVNAAEYVFDGTKVNAAGILPQVAAGNGQTRPFLGNTTMETYLRSNCTGCHAKSFARNGLDELINADMMYFLALRANNTTSNAISYDVAPVSRKCVPDTQGGVLDFSLNMAVRNEPVVAQSFNLLAAIELPESVNSSDLLALDAAAMNKTWEVAGKPVLFQPDPQCAPGACEADLQFPSASGHRWVQYRTTEPIMVGMTGTVPAGMLRFQITAPSCHEISQGGYRVWASDDSQRSHANFVDGDLLAGDLKDVIEVLPFATSPADFEAIPTLSMAALVLLAMLLLAAGLLFYRD